MKTKITLYKNTDFTDEKNFRIDNFSEYLTNRNFNKKEISSLAYIKPELYIVIKLDLSQSYLDISTTDKFNYLKLEHYDDNGYKSPFYYFITNWEWRSTSALRLTCKMDILNSFDTNPSSQADFKLSPRTKVLREHKDRWEEYDYDTGMVKMGSDVFGGVNVVKTFNYQLYLLFPHNYPFIRRVEVVSTNVYDITFKFLVGAENQLILESFNEYELSVLYDENFGSGVVSAEIISHENYEENDEVGVLAVVRLTASDSDFYFRVYLLADAQKYMLRRDIDIYSEGLSPVLYKEELGILRDELDTNWYIVYTAKNDIQPDITQPIDGLIYPEDQFNIKYSTASKEVAVNDLTDTQYLVFSNSYNNAGFTLERGVSTYSTSFQKQRVGEITIGTYKDFYTYTCYVIKRNGANLELIRVIWEEETDYTFWIPVSRTWSKSEELVSSDNTNIKIQTEETSIIICKDSGTLPNQLPPANYTMSFAELTDYINPFSAVNKSSSKISKIIKLPYCPVEYKLSAGKLVFDSTLTFDDTSHNLSIVNLDTPFQRVVKTSIDNPIAEVLNPIELPSLTYYKNGSRHNYYESKLYQSPFYQIKFAYDSFTFIFQLENIEWNAWHSNYKDSFTFTFIPTTTMNSKMLFRFDEYILRYSTEDYDNILTASRNNEVVIYNSVYLNYLRTSYNYDLKAKERTIRTSRAQAIMGGIGAVASLGLSLAGGSVASKIIAPLNASTSLANTIIGSVNAIAQAEESLASKMAVLQNESVSVSGSDDIDLLQAYSQNKAKLMIYKTSERLRNALADLFYYCGYATNEMKVPNVYSRRQFNFLACEVEFSAVKQNISDDIVEELRKKYLDGITFIHKYDKANKQYDWDTAQVKANMETFIEDLYPEEE